MQEWTPSKKDNEAPQNSTENSYLQGQFLIAMPGLEDPHFKQSITLICQHNSDGCFGLTINKPIDVSVDNVLKQLKLKPKTKSATKITENNTQNNNPDFNKPALRGGPVQIEQGFIIHDNNDNDKQWENTISISEDLLITASQDILIDIAAGDGPENYLLALGCASWVSGQIEAEILNNSWLNCPIDKKIIFNMPFEKRWQGAADLLGINLSAMSAFSGHD